MGSDSIPYKITGICKDVPENSHLKFDMLASYTTPCIAGKNPYKQADYDFTDSDFWHYLQLRHGADYKELCKQSLQHLAKNISREIKFRAAMKNFICNRFKQSAFVFRL